MRFLLLIFLLCSQPALAWNEFFSEADETLQNENLWARTTFKKNDGGIRSVFRVWYPHSPGAIWGVLTDTNLWKEIHGEYSDSHTLDKKLFDAVTAAKPKNIKAYYEIVGQPGFPSHYGRRNGGTWFSYVFQRFNFPWPFADHWAVTRVKNDETGAAKGHYRYEYKMTAGNFKESKGYWEILPHPTRKGWSEFRGDYRADPGFPAPHFITRSLFKSTLEKSRQENIDELARRSSAHNPKAASQ